MWYESQSSIINIKHTAGNPSFRFDCQVLNLSINSYYEKSAN